jgi:hypothetical protein
MTDKEFVLSIIPTAIISYSQYSVVIFSSFPYPGNADSVMISEGNTSIEAWKNAKDKIGEQLARKLNS